MSSNKDPAFLFYSSDFLTGVSFLSDEQTGKYIKLLCYQHQKGHLSEKHMLSICKAYDREVFSKFEKDENGDFFNLRLDIEIEKRRKYSESRRCNAKKKNKTEHMQSICKTYDHRMHDHMENTNTNENIIMNIIKEEKIVKKGNPKLSDDEFIQSLKNNFAYQGINIDRELGKIDAWLSLPKNQKRKKTKQFIVNWLNRIEVPMEVKKQNLVSDKLFQSLDALKDFRERQE